MKLLEVQVAMRKARILPVLGLAVALNRVLAGEVVVSARKGARPFQGERSVVVEFHAGSISWSGRIALRAGRRSAQSSPAVVTMELARWAVFGRAPASGRSPNERGGHDRFIAMKKTGPGARAA